MRNMGLPDYLRLLPKLGLFFGVISSVAGCVQVGKRGGSGSGLFVSVDVTGMQPGDENLKGIKYALLCNQGTESAYQIDGRVLEPRTANNSIDFPDDKLNFNDTCALSVTAEALTTKDGSAYTWLAYKNGKAVEGLFYRSNFDTVKIFANPQKAGKSSKYLKFDLIKVYGVEYSDPFDLQVTLSFVKEENAVLPQRSGLIASLHCFPKDSNDQSLRFQESTTDAAPVSNKPDDRVFTFRLSAAKSPKTNMTNKQCDKVTVAVDNVLLYQGDLSDVVFTTPKVGERKTIGPFSVGPAQESFGDVSCSARGANNVCEAVTFSEANPIWFLLAKAKKPGVSDFEVIVTHAAGLAPSPVNVISLASMNSDLKNPTGNLRYYKADVLQDLLNSNFEPQALQSMLSQKTQAMGTDVELVAMTSVYTHGFKTVAEGYLNMMSGARWFALVTASAGKDLKRFLVGGFDKYFLTSSLTKPAGTVYFTSDFFRKHRSFNEGKYRSYAFQEGGLNVPACQMSLEAIRRTLGQKGLSALTTANTDLDKCDVTTGSALDFIANPSWVLSPRFYVWGWHKLSL